MTFSLTNKQSLWIALALAPSELEADSQLSKLMEDVEALDTKNGNTFLEDRIKTLLTSYETCKAEARTLRTADVANKGIKQITVEEEYSLVYTESGSAVQSKANECGSFLEELRRLLDPYNFLGSNSFGYTRVYPN